MPRCRTGAEISVFLHYETVRPDWRLGALMSGTSRTADHVQTAKFGGFGRALPRQRHRRYNRKEENIKCLFAHFARSAKSR